MRRLCALSAVFFVCAGIFLGCSTQQAKKEDDKKVAIDPNVKVDPIKGKTGDDKKPENKNGGGPKAVADDKQDKYEEALADALSALAERKWADALEAFEAAKSFQDTEFVQSEITKLKARVDQQGVAKNTVKNIETVLNDGDADEAAKLAAEALREFGDGDDAEKLIQLRIQAEAVRDAEKKEGADVRYTRFKKEGDVAMQEKNLRAAALAYEQALEAKADDGLQTTYEGIRTKLDEYDALRKKGLQLSKDPLQLEEALAAFKGAVAAWDTLQIRADIDDAQLALAKRRDTVAVADFEMRNDVGMPGAGAALAEELLPRLKARYDLVERNQLKQVLGELNVQQGFLDDFKQQQQIGKLANARYLVVGSVQRLVGVTVRARLVDTRTGLIVQSAKIVSDDMEDALNDIPNLAKQLLMNDEAKMQFEEEMQKQVAKPAEKAPDNAPLPPAPLAPAANAPAQPPPPPPMVNPAPPVFAQQNQAVFKNFAPPPQVFVQPQVDPLQELARNRLLYATIEMGDFLFRVGRFREAERRFEFALALAPDNFDIRLRLERVRPLVPPAAFTFIRPRIAIMPFMTVRLTPFGPPTYLSYWTPRHLSPYFAWRYDVVDPDEVYWYMGRMGLTMNDLLVDPSARRWLGRAIGVRYFVFGNHIETASFDVNTYLIDAELGYLQGGATINVRDVHELKLRLPEIAEITMLNPAERAAYLANANQQRFVRLLADGRQHMAQRRFHDAMREFEAALQIYPNNVQARVLFEQSRQQAVFIDFTVTRRTGLDGRKAITVAQQQRQWQLAQSAELARQQAIAEAARRDEAQNRTHLSLRFAAQSNLVTRAEIALKTKNFGLSVSFFQGAANFAPPPVVGVPVPVSPVNYQSFAQARLQAERAEQVRIAQLTAVREATLRQEREKQLAAAQKQILAERAAAQARLEAQRKAQVEHDLVAFDAAIKQGTNYMTQAKYEAALAAFQGAQRVAHNQKQNERVNTLIDIVVQRQAEALATTKEDKSAVERKLLVERERRKAAESLAQQNEEKYQLALVAAQAALKSKKFSEAKTKFQEAGDVFKTDAVLTGLRQVENGEAALLADAKKVDADSKKDVRIKQLLADGKTALTAKKYGDALTAYREAKKLDPDNLDARAGMTQAEEAYARVSADENRKNEEASRVQNFQRLLKSGQANLATKQFEAAVANLSEAVKLNPTDATAVAALKQAEKGRDAAFTNAKTQAAAKERAVAYQKLINEGRLALNNKRYADAINAFGGAQKLLPGDQASKNYLDDAQAAKKAAEDAAAVAAKQRADDTKRMADLQAALTQGRTALAAKDFNTAAKALAQAQKLGPNNVDVKNALQSLEQAQKQAAAAAAAEKQRLTQFNAFLATGKAALNAKKYPEALKALSSATSLVPSDKEAQDLFRRAQAEARQADDAAAKAKLQELITTGLAALKTKNYDAAEKALRSAAQVDPTNPTITQGLKDIAAGRQVLANEKLQASFNSAMSQGQKALQGGDFNTAIAQANQALKLFPNDKNATGLLQQAQVGQKKANDYQVAMAAGNKALAAKNYKGATNAFNDALKLFPNDTAARAGLKSAQPPTPPDPPKIDFDAAMKRGAAAEKDNNYADALKAYNDALKARPKDQQASNNAQFAQAIVNAEQAINGKMWVDAQREVDNALRLRPKNAYATKLLQRVKKKN